MVIFYSAQTAITEAHRLAAFHKQPWAIYRRKAKRVEIQAEQIRNDRSVRWAYTLESAWRAKSDKAGELVMIVSVTGLERAEGPWEVRPIFEEAMIS